MFVIDEIVKIVQQVMADNEDKGDALVGQDPCDWIADTLVHNLIDLQKPLKWFVTCSKSKYASSVISNCFCLIDKQSDGLCILQCNRIDFVYVVCVCGVKL
ncbi:hypothetical protein GJ496_002315 [Pomphorhynchus laevis]|nr:hypothetical protein GJ496_002315 [Pomphorhynchus laevis]